VTWKRILAVVLTLGSLYFVIAVLVSQWDDIRGLVDVQTLALFVAATTPFYIVTAISGALAWSFAFRSTGESMPLVAGLRVHLLSQIGKYFPGNVGHFVGRLGMLRLEGYSVSKGAVSIVLEILWIIGAAAALSVYALFTGALSIVENAHEIAGWLPLLVLLLAFVTPNLMILIFNMMPERARTMLGFTGKIRRPPEQVVLGCYALYFLNFAINGAILVIGLHWLFDVQVNDVLLVISLHAVVWLLGFILPGAPGGLGVREALFVLLFGSLYGAGIVATTAVVMRVISVLGDVFAFGLGILLSRFFRTPRVTA